MKYRELYDAAVQRADAGIVHFLQTIDKRCQTPDASVMQEVRRQFAEVLADASVIERIFAQCVLRGRQITNVVFGTHEIGLMGRKRVYFPENREDRVDK